MRAVLDASVAIKWFLPWEEGSDQANTLLKQGAEYYAPQFFRIEFFNVLLKYVRRGLISQAEFNDMRLDFETMRIIEFIPDEDLEFKAIELSMHIAHPLYDCLYLACAMQQEIPFISADEAFMKKIMQMDNHLRQYALPLGQV